MLVEAGGAGDDDNGVGGKVSTRFGVLTSRGAMVQGGTFGITPSAARGAVVGGVGGKSFSFAIFLKSNEPLGREFVTGVAIFAGLMTCSFTGPVCTQSGFAVEGFGVVDSRRNGGGERGIPPQPDSESLLRFLAAGRGVSALAS